MLSKKEGVLTFPSIRSKYHLNKGKKKNNKKLTTEAWYSHENTDLIKGWRF